MANSTVAWAFNTKASPFAKLVLLNLADNADRYGRVRFSLASLASECSMDLWEIELCLAELVSKMLITFEKSDMSKRENEPWLQILLLTKRNFGEVSYVTH